MACGIFVHDNCLTAVEQSTEFARMLEGLQFGMSGCSLWTQTQDCMWTDIFEGGFASVNLCAIIQRFLVHSTPWAVAWCLGLHHLHARCMYAALLLFSTQWL